MSEDTVESLIMKIIEDDKNNVYRVQFQQDRAPPHYLALERGDYFDKRYHGRRIGMGCPIEWPARSPNLWPLDFIF